MRNFARFILAVLLIPGILTYMVFGSHIQIARAADSVQIEGWGGGQGAAAGGNDGTGGTGGGAGAYARVNAFLPASGTGYTVTVGTGGAGGVVSTTNGINGATTTFNGTTLVASPGGNGQVCGNGAESSPCLGGFSTTETGDFKTAGGNGTNALTVGISGGGGGGSGGDTTGGGNGANATGATSPGAGGTAGTTNGATGATGGNAAAGGTGTVPGSGGGGGQGSSTAGSRKNGGAGAAGKVIIKATLGDYTATGGTHTTSGGQDVWTFTSSGTWTPTSIPNSGSNFSIKSSFIIESSLVVK